MGGADPTADFRSGREYRVCLDGPAQPYAVLDADEQVAALVPVRPGGEVRTRTGCWNVRPERRRPLGWAMIARTSSDGMEAGGVAEALLPNHYRLWINPDTAYRMTANVLNGTWTIKDGRTRIARLTATERFLAGRHDVYGRQRPAGTITTFDGMFETGPLGLAIVLALVMIIAEGSIPEVASAATPY